MWIGISRSEFRIMQVDWCPFMHLESICPIKCKNFALSSFRLVHEVEGFAVSKVVMGLGRILLQGREPLVMVSR